MTPNFSIDEFQLMTGVDIPIEGFGITIRQPTLKEISILGETKYFIGLKLFGMKVEDISHLVQVNTDISNWAIFQEALQQKIDGIVNTRQFCTNFLQLFFYRKVQILSDSILLMGSNEDICHIESVDFNYLQQIIQIVGGAKILGSSSDQQNFKPKNKKAKEIAEKMKKARKRLEKIKSNENNISSNIDSFIGKFMKIVCIGTHTSLEDVKKMTLYSLSEIAQGYLAKEAYDLDISSRLAGAKNDKPLTHWTVKGNKEDDGIGII